jgi:Family of unknown function (DUF5723)
MLSSRIHFVYFFVLCTYPVFAQGLQGVRSERWAGISGVHLNPASSNVFPKKWDVQLGGFHLYGSTNYFFLSQTGLIELLSRPEDIRAISDTLGEAVLPTKPIFLDFPDGNRKWQGVLDSRIDGPGFAVRIGQRHSIGMFSALRTVASGYGIPRTMGYKHLDAVRWGEAQKAGAFQISGMSWVETGAHYAYRSPDNGGNLWGFGVNLKHLNVIQAGYAKTNESFQYIRNGLDTMTLTNGNWDIGYNTDIANNIMDPSTKNLHSNGQGFSFDLGFNYLVSDLESDTPEDYQWQFGASLTDIGYAKINKNAERHHFDFNDSKVLSLEGINTLRTVDEVVRLLSATYLQDSMASLKGNSFTLLTPARVNIHSDYRVRKNFYVNAVWQQRLPMTDNTIKLPSYIAITPRFESRWFSAFAPVGLTDYNRLQAGLAIRVAYFTIGSDHLTSLIHQRQWNSTDLYLSCKINAFKFSSKDRGLSSKDRKWKRVGCYN